MATTTGIPRDMDIELQGERRSHSPRVSSAILTIQPQLLDKAEVNPVNPRQTGKSDENEGLLSLDFKSTPSHIILAEQPEDMATPPLRYGSSTVENQKIMTRHS
jgi:hypothetical protein